MSLSRVMRNVVQRQHVEAAEQLGQLAPRPALPSRMNCGLVALAERHEPRQDLRHLHHGEQLLRPQAAAPLEHRRQVQAAIVKARAGMGRVDRHRRQNRECPLAEEVVERFALRRRSARRAAAAGFLRGQLRQHRFVPAAVLGGDEFLRALGDPLQLRDRPQAVGGEVLRGAVAEGLLAQARPRGP